MTDEVESTLMPPERNAPNLQKDQSLRLPVVPQFPDPLALSLDPNRSWFTQLGGVSKHIITNHSSDRLAIKVRCSNNKTFRVNPVFFFLEINQPRDFEVIRLQGGDIRKDKIQILFTIARDDDIEPAQLFGKNNKVRSIILSVITI